MWLSTAAAVVVILVTPVIGLLSDRVGRKPVLALLALGNAVLPITMFALMASGSHARRCSARWSSPRWPAGSARSARSPLPSNSPAKDGSPASLWARPATAIFGGLTPWLAQYLVERTGWTMAPGAMIALVGLCVLPLFLWMRETAPRSARAEPVQHRLDRPEQDQQVEPGREIFDVVEVVLELVVDVRRPRRHGPG